MKKIVVGMTGPTGSGKSTVGRLLREEGFKIVDADKTARRVTEKGSPTLVELCAAFGEDILLESGELNRAELATRAFADEESLEKLNSITHPAIIELIKKEITDLQAEGEERIILDAPQLFEAGAQSLCDYIISVLADKETRLERIMVRDDISQEQALSRINAQKSDEFFVENSNFVIYNNSDTDALRPQIDSLLDEVLGVEKVNKVSASACQPFSTNPETQAMIERTNRRPSAKKRFAVLGAAVVFVLAVIIGVIVFFASGSYTDAIEKSIELCKNPSTQTIEDVYPEQMWEVLLDKYSHIDENIDSVDDIIEKYLLSQTQEIGQKMNDDFGQDWEIDYEIISKVKLDKETVSQISEDVRKTSSKDTEASKAYSVNLAYTISGSKTSDGFMSFTAVKIDGEWYAVEKFPEKGWMITVLEF